MDDDWRSGLGYRLPDVPPPAPAAGRSADANVTSGPGYYHPNSNNPDWLNAQGQSGVHPHQNSVHSYPIPGPYHPHLSPTEVPNGVGYPHYYNNHSYHYQYGQYGGYQYQYPHPPYHPYYQYTQHYQQQVPVPYQYSHNIPYPEASHYVPATTNSATEHERRSDLQEEAANNSHINTHSSVPVDSISAEADDDGWISNIEEIDYRESNVNILNTPHSDVPVCEKQSQKQSAKNNTNLEKEAGSKGARIPLSVNVPQSTIPLNEVLSDLSPQKSFGSSVSGESSKESATSDRTGAKRKRVTFEVNNDEDDLAEFLGRTNRRVSARCYATKASRKEKDGDDESTSSSSLSDNKDKRTRVSRPATPMKASGEGETGESISNRRRVPETISIEKYIAGLPASVSPRSEAKPVKDASLERVLDQVSQMCTKDNSENSVILEKAIPMDSTVNCMEPRSSSFVNQVPISEIQLSVNVNPSTSDCNNESEDLVLDIRIRTDIFEDEEDISDD